MIICDHNGFRHPSAHYAPEMVHHGEVDIESDFFSMMTAVTCNAERQHDRSRREFKDFSTVELNDAGRVFLTFALHLAGTITIRFRFRTGGSHSSGQFFGHSFRLQKRNE
jgi:hypothetical protein